MILKQEIPSLLRSIYGVGLVYGFSFFCGLMFHVLSQRWLPFGIVLGFASIRAPFFITMQYLRMNARKGYIVLSNKYDFMQLFLIYFFIPLLAVPFALSLGITLRHILILPFSNMVVGFILLHLFFKNFRPISYLLRKYRF